MLEGLKVQNQEELEEKNFSVSLLEKVIQSLGYCPLATHAEF